MTDALNIRLRGDGLWLAADVYGPVAGAPILFFHGGGQSRKSWAGSARKLARAGFRAYTVDLRGHGDSDWSPDGRYLLDVYGRDVEALIDGFDKPVALVGASRGGQAALVGGSRRPGRVSLIVMADVAPGMQDSGLDEIREFLWASTRGFADVEAAADALTQYLGRPRLADVSGLKKTLREAGDGRLYWKWDPATVKPEFINPPSEVSTMDAAAAAVVDPVLLVRAELSTIVTDASEAYFRTLTPQLRVTVAKGVGHMFTGDDNDAFATTLIDTLSKPQPRRHDANPA